MRSLTLLILGLLAGCVRAPAPPQPVLACPPAGDTTIYEGAALPQKVTRISGPLPVYPPDLKRALVNGEATIVFVLDTLGHPESGSARVESATDMKFGWSALDVVRATVFTPGYLCGRRVRVRVHIPIRFSVTRS